MLNKMVSHCRPVLLSRRVFTIPQTLVRSVSNKYSHLKKTKLNINFVDVLAGMQRTTLTWAEIRDWVIWKAIEKMRDDQRFKSKRHRILGPDLAAAHFIVFRQGKVRFQGSEEWLTDKDVTKTEKIPSVFERRYRLEAIDASNSILCFEGLGNFVDLRYLKELHLKGCNYIDDFCLNRLQIVQSSLEYLDISGCQEVTERGLCTLHYLKKLKKLIIHDTPGIVNKELACVLLQDVLPQCHIEGVDYNSPGLMKRLQRFI